MQELLGLVGPGRDPGALAELQHRLLRRRPVAACAGDEDLRLRRRRARPGARSSATASGEPGDVLAAQRGDRGDGAGIARRVAPASARARACRRSTSLGELGQRESRARPSRATSAPARRAAASSVSGVPPSWEMQTIRSASRRREHGLERLQRDAARLRRVERRPAADEDDATRPRAAAIASAPRASHVGLREHGTTGLAGHRSPLYHRSVPVFERHTLGNGLRVLTAPLPARPVGRLLRHARGRLALRARRRIAASRTSPSTCSSRAPSGARARAT